MAGEAIFIGYRRDDTADVAGRVYDAMIQRFGKNRVFKDVDNIGPGIDFGDYIKNILPKCCVALILIGPHWLQSRDEDGSRRLEDEQDWVRIEIETSLSTPNVLVVPVLVNGARMPRSSDLPDSLRPLLRRNAAMIRRDPDFHDDVERLASALRASVSGDTLNLNKVGGQRSASQVPHAKQTGRSGTKRASAVMGAMAAVLIAGLAIWSPWRGVPAPSTPAEVSSGSNTPTEGGSETSTPTEVSTASSTSAVIDLFRGRWRLNKNEQGSCGAPESTRTFVNSDGSLGVVATPSDGTEFYDLQVTSSSPPTLSSVSSHGDYYAIIDDLIYSFRKDGFLYCTLQRAE